MPEITIYTNDGDCANGVAEINPFTVGDATDEWTLKFNNGTDFYSPSNVTMRVGHTNGLPDGIYDNAFKWVDRADNTSQVNISVSSGVPSATFTPAPLGGVIGSNGVNILRGPELNGAITSISIVDSGQPAWFYRTFSGGKLVITPQTGDVPVRPADGSYSVTLDSVFSPNGGGAGQISYLYHKFTDNLQYGSNAKYWTSVGRVSSTNATGIGSTKPEIGTAQKSEFLGQSKQDGRVIAVTPLLTRGSGLIIDGVGSLEDTAAGGFSGILNNSVSWILARCKLGSITLADGGVGYKAEPTISFTETSMPPQGATDLEMRQPQLDIKMALASYEFPFKRDESGNDIIAATTLSPYSDGQVTDTTQYDHSTLVIRPETVATASLTSSGLNWVGTMNPINAYTTSRLSLRNSTQLDLQIRGDGRTLFQGQLTILNKIA
jgi:hypothetical protein